MNGPETHVRHTTAAPLRMLMSVLLVLTTCIPAGVALNAPATAQAASVGPGSVITGTLLCVDGTERFTWQGIPSDGYYQYRGREASLFKFQIRNSDDDGQLGDSFGGNWFWMECVEYGRAAPETGDIYNFSFYVDEVFGNVITGTMCAGINNALTGTIDHHQSTEARMSIPYTPPTGGLQMSKRSDASNITNGNPLYKLSGVEFGIWSDPDCNSETHGTGKSILLDEDGYGHVEDLPEGTYYIRELEHSMNGTNYAYNGSLQQATVVANTNNVWVHYTANGLGDIDGNDVTNSPISDEMNLRIRKADAETGRSVPMSTATLAGAKFKLSYFANINGDISGNAERVWYYQTDESGTIACMDENALLAAESSALFKNAAGDTTLPVGTYSLEETKAPDGYMPAVNSRGENVVYKFVITADGSHNAHGTRVYYTNQNGQGYEVAHSDDGSYSWPDAELTVSEQIKRGNVQFVKQEEDSTPIANCPFLLRALDGNGNVIEQHVIVTDENGIFDSSYDHSQKTNANDAALIANADGTYSIDASKLDSSAGVWFGTDANGMHSSPSDSLGALPYGNYDLTELAGSANVHLRLVGSRGLKITHNNQLVNLGTITDKQPLIHTSARDAADGDTLLTTDTNASIEDIVTYENLNPGQSYTLKGRLMDKTSGRPLIDAHDREIAAQTTFTPSAPNGSVSLTFDFDATALADDSDLVVFESLVTGGDTHVASHEDIEDADQTIRIVRPSIKTSVQDETDGDRIIAPNEKLTIVDTVSYSGLTVNRRYEIKGVLVDKVTGRAVEVDGQKVVASSSFVAHDAQGTVPVTFTFDSTGLDDKADFVVFETLLKDGVTLAVHADLHDTDQTVTMERPRIGTTAADETDGDQVVYADTDATIVDTVSYKGLIPGQEYTICGTLMDKVTGEELRDAQGGTVTASTSFIPESSSGAVDVRFVFDASHINAALKAVAFETLLLAETELASHRDIDDALQTITLMQPSIATTARDATDGDQVVCRDLEAKIIDTVHYTGLKAGETYRIDGILMNKATKQTLQDADGKDVTASAEFIAEGETGNTDVVFSFDATCVDENTDLVCFETLTRDGSTLAEHIDIEDSGQTIRVSPPTFQTSACDADDGDKVIFADERINITDTIAYSGLTPGKEYTVEGTLMDKETGQAVLDANGDLVTARNSFSPETPDGSMEMRFSFDASNVVTEREFVAFEKLYRESRFLAAHADIDDSSQTVTVTPSSIQTYALDAFDNDKTIMRGQQATITDRVTYSNLTAGDEYTLVGELMVNDGTLEGTPALDAFGAPITARKAFIASEPHGFVDLDFAVDSTLFEEDALTVVFEKLSHNGTVVASHQDIKDAGQTVSIVRPALNTHVSDTADGDQELLVAQSSTLVDTVEYMGLNTNETYSVQGKLMDKSTGKPIQVSGKEVTSKTDFVATSDSGSVDVRFNFSTGSLAGKDIVVFEQLSNSDKVVLATHEDVNAKSQTAHVVATPNAPNPSTTLTRTLKKLVKTADPFFWIIAASLACGAFSVTVFVILRRRAR